jgi:eukaryotic-like serine/threonine-protein kinase
MGNAPMIGQKLGSFRIDSVLGAGAMGVVYRGVSETSGREVALKVVIGELAQKGTAYERFKREAEILQQFRHPNIVRFLAVGRYQGTSYFAMEFVQGVTLDTLLEQRGYLPWQEVVHLGIQMCDALHYAHQHGVVHRDLKPSNLMITDKGQVKLTDFGIAKDLDATALTATGRTLGTAAYMAPEQIRGTPEVSHKTDLYALGVVLYEMLTGEVPFQGPTAVVMMHRHLSDEPPRPSGKLTDIPLELDKLVIRLMAKEPTDRPWDAAAVGMVVTEIRDAMNRGEAVSMVWPTSGDGSEVRTRPKKPRKRKRKERYTGKESNRLQTGLLVLALAAALGLIGYLLWPPSAQYLYKKAEALMASENSADWLAAQRDYLDELDRRFPDHAYRKQTEEWRDRLLLHKAERRAAVIEKSSFGSVSRGQNRAETLYEKAFEQTKGPINTGRYIEALIPWKDMIEVTATDPEERGWHLLAVKRFEMLNQKIGERRDDLKEKLDRADLAYSDGRFDEAIGARAEIVDKYKDFKMYPDLQELVARAYAGLPRPEPSEQPAAPVESSAGRSPTETTPPPQTEPPPTEPRTVPPDQ